MFIEVYLGQSGHQIHDEVKINEILGIRLESLQIEHADIPFNLLFGDLVDSIEVFLLAVVSSLRCGHFNARVDELQS